MNLKRILFCLTAFAAAIATSVPCAAKRPSGSDLRLLYWNIQNGMWSGQDDNYDRFVEWVKEFDADVCVWCEAQSIYRSGTADRMPEPTAIWSATGANWRCATATSIGTWAVTATISRR